MRAALLLVTLAACSTPARPPAPDAAPAPSDEGFLAARAAVAARLGTLFEANVWLLAPDPEGAGAPTRADLVSSVPDLADFAAAAQPPLPAPTSRLAGCHAATVRALAAFTALSGPTLGEGKMGGGKLTPEQRFAEATRQIDATTAAYCLWRDASRVCHAEAGTPPFEHRFLVCR